MLCFGRLGNSTESGIPETIDVSGFTAVYLYQSLAGKDETGDGGFSVVFTAILPHQSKKIVVKKLLSKTDEAKKMLVKEAHLIQKFALTDITVK